MAQFPVTAGEEVQLVSKPKKQLLKWIGNKQRFAQQIIASFPTEYGTYYEPFLGSGAVLGTLAPKRAIGSDGFKPLIEIWQMLQQDPEMLKMWYAERWQAMMSGNKVEQYEMLKAVYNAQPNGADLLFLCRACYGGVVRFRQRDGYMSTPCGAHTPISPESFAQRVDEWMNMTKGATFDVMDYKDAMQQAQCGDLVYCDPPYSYSQNILYGAQAFDLRELLHVIAHCKARGVFVALSIDGTKQSGHVVCDISMPDDLFVREVVVNCGRSMLKRFQMDGRTMEHEIVADRLLLTY
ncbi:MAG: DNA adenine methylase [Ktedonobacteraceae bacterium]